MAKHRTHSIEFERQVAQEHLVGETLHGLSLRHDLSRNLVRIWVEKDQVGGLDEDAAAPDLLQSYEARIVALERLVGKQAVELEFLNGASRAGLRPRSVTTSGMSPSTFPGSSATSTTASGLPSLGYLSPNQFENQPPRQTVKTAA